MKLEEEFCVTQKLASSSLSTELNKINNKQGLDKKKDGLDNQLLTRHSPIQIVKIFFKCGKNRGRAMTGMKKKCKDLSNGGINYHCTAT